MDDMHLNALEDAVYRALEDGTPPSDVVGEVQYICDRYIEDLEDDDE